jgi:hypothetical protein
LLCLGACPGKKKALEAVSRLACDKRVVKQPTQNLSNCRRTSLRGSAGLAEPAVLKCAVMLGHITL